MKKNKIVIMGATSGIGLEVAKLYIRAGWQVAVAGRQEKPLEELKVLAPAQVVTGIIDITDPEAGKKLFSLIEKNGGMDIYLHCSGIGSQNPKLEPEIELNTLRTNGEGFTRMITEVFGYFRQNGGGHMAAISSIAGTQGIGLAPAYSATKRFQNIYLDALEQLSRIEKLNIRFTDIRPGFVATPLLKDDTYPMMMDAPTVAQKIVHAINRKKRIAIIDWKYRLMVFFWKLIPRWLWVRLPIKYS